MAYMTAGQAFAYGGKTIADAYTQAMEQKRQQAALAQKEAAEEARRKEELAEKRADRDYKWFQSLTKLASDPNISDQKREELGNLGMSLYPNQNSASPYVAEMQNKAQPQQPVGPSAALSLANRVDQEQGVITMDPMSRTPRPPSPAPVQEEVPIRKGSSWAAPGRVNGRAGTDIFPRIVAAISDADSQEESDSLKAAYMARYPEMAENLKGIIWAPQIRESRLQPMGHDPETNETVYRGTTGERVTVDENGKEVRYTKRSPLKPLTMRLMPGGEVKDLATFKRQKEEMGKLRDYAAKHLDKIGPIDNLIAELKSYTIGDPEYERLRRQVMQQFDIMYGLTGAAFNAGELQRAKRAFMSRLNDPDANFMAALDEIEVWLLGEVEGREKEFASKGYYAGPRQTQTKPQPDRNKKMKRLRELRAKAGR